MAPFYVVLLHVNVRNRHGEAITSAVTNLDIHDIARSARTYGARRFFIVTPIEEQHELVERILEHWRTEKSRQYHPDRFEAISLVRLVKTFEEVKAAIAKECGPDAEVADVADSEAILPEVILTDARPLPNSISF